VGAVQLPGRENRFGEPALHHMDEVVAGVVQAALPLMREKPFAFFGHSLGAIVALEVSRALARAAGPEPVHVIVSARRAPHLPPRGERLATLPREDLLDWLRRVNGTPKEVLQNRDLVDTFLPSLRADLNVDDTYESTPDPRLTSPLTAFGGSGDEETLPEEMEAWADYTAGPFAHRQFEGGHFFAFNQAQAATLAAVADVLRPSP
jgi:medium-chain acyl-[acyl-carrier-protein] hydrolase